MIVKDRRTLRRMANRGLIIWPVPKYGSKEHLYVDESAKGTFFEFEGQRYRLKYFDGCIFPFVTNE